MFFSQSTVFGCNDYYVYRAVVRAQRRMTVSWWLMTRNYDLYCVPTSSYRKLFTRIICNLTSFFLQDPRFPRSSPSTCRDLRQLPIWAVGPHRALATCWSRAARISMSWPSWVVLVTSIKGSIKICKQTCRCARVHDRMCVILKTRNARIRLNEENLLQWRH